MPQQAQGQTTSTSCNTSPINIDMNTSVPSCNILCSYKYDYNDSKCVVSINSLGYLEIKYDLKRDGTEAQSSLNRDNYNIADIRIYQPSIHTYDGKQADVELIIHHVGASNGQTTPKELYVSIPFIASDSPLVSANNGGIILENIILQYAKQTPSPGDNVHHLNIDNFNMNNFIPSAPYYFYNGTPYDTTDCSITNINYLVFDTIRGGQTIGSSALAKLQKLLPSNRAIYPIAKNTVYLSSNNPNYSGGMAGDDKIYIDCQPTGEDGKSLYKLKGVDELNNQEEINNGLKTILKLFSSPASQFIIAVFLGIVVIKFGKKVFAR
jgi:hypothetical protein